jgi:glycine/D-amino acid oxidase-like deaminating enzyme
MPAAYECEVDALIFGGGVAGLWTLDAIVRSGRSAILVERSALGSGQTVCAQGIIHGGLKYTLDGLLSRSASVIRDMPDVWRACLRGEREPSLAATRLRADHCHLWRSDSLASRLGMIGARLGLRVKPQPIDHGNRPAALRGVPGVVTRLAEPVIDPCSLLADLAARHKARVIRADRQPAVELVSSRSCSTFTLTDSTAPAPLRVRSDHVILSAGAGNEELCRLMGIDGTPMQRRPLHMLLLRGELPELNGHCVDGAKTRVTITSDVDSAGRRVWQVGGQVAEDGVGMDGPAFIEHAIGEVRAALPGVEFDGIEAASYGVDRAEPSVSGGARPEDAFAKRVNRVGDSGSVIVAWPTKLALAPALAERVVSLLDPPHRRSNDAAALEAIASWPRPAVASPPWETCTSWSVVRSAARG